MKMKIPTQKKSRCHAGTNQWDVLNARIHNIRGFTRRQCTAQCVQCTVQTLQKLCYCCKKRSEIRAKC